MAKQIISELEKMSIEISKPDCKERKRMKKKDKSCEIIIKGVTHAYDRNTRKTNREQEEEIFEAVMTHHF